MTRPLPVHVPRLRDGRGRYTRSPGTAERDAEAARLRLRGLTYPQIADHMGYADHTGARDAVQRALKAIVAEPAEEALQLALARLDYEYQVALHVLESNHYVVTEKGLVFLGTEPLVDHAPVLAAIQTMLRIEDQRAKLLGLYAPSKQNIHVLTEDMLDAELRRLNEELAKRGADPVTVDT